MIGSKNSAVRDVFPSSPAIDGANANGYAERKPRLEQSLLSKLHLLNLVEDIIPILAHPVILSSEG